MQRNNAKDDAVEGGENGERPPSSQPIAPAAAGQAPPRPAGRITPQFDPSWSRGVRRCNQARGAFHPSPAVVPLRLPQDQRGTGLRPFDGHEFADAAFSAADDFHRVPGLADP